MSLVKRYLYIVFSIFLLASCAKEDSDVFIPDPTNPQNDTAWRAGATISGVSAQFEEAFYLPPLIDSFDYSVGKKIQFNDSLEITIPQTFSNASVIDGKVMITVQVLKAKGDYIRLFQPTLSEDQKLLASHVMLNITISTKAGVDLEIATGKQILVRFATNQSSSNLTVFYKLGSNIWQSSSPTPNVNPWSGSPNGVPLQGYSFAIRKLGWISCSNYSSWANTPYYPSVHVLLPPNFTNNNTIILAILNSEKTIIPFLPEFPSRTFISTYLPIEAGIKIITLSKIGNEFYLGNKDITVSSTTAAIKVSPQKITQQDLIQYMLSL